MMEKNATRILDQGAAMVRQSGRGRLVIVKGPDLGETINVGDLDMTVGDAFGPSGDAIRENFNENEGALVSDAKAGFKGGLQAHLEFAQSNGFNPHAMPVNLKSRGATNVSNGCQPKVRGAKQSVKTTLE